MRNSYFHFQLLVIVICMYSIRSTQNKNTQYKNSFYIFFPKNHLNNIVKKSWKYLQNTQTKIVDLFIFSTKLVSCIRQKFAKICTKTNIVHNLIEINIQNIHIKTKEGKTIWMNEYTDKVSVKEGINGLYGSWKR